jgi:hypothetical protein
MIFNHIKPTVEHFSNLQNNIFFNGEIVARNNCYKYFTVIININLYFFACFGGSCGSVFFVHFLQLHSFCIVSAIARIAPPFIPQYCTAKGQTRPITTATVRNAGGRFSPRVTQPIGGGRAVDICPPNYCTTKAVESQHKNQNL